MEAWASRRQKYQGKPYFANNFQTIAKFFRFRQQKSLSLQAKRTNMKALWEHSGDGKFPIRGQRMAYPLERGMKNVALSAKMTIFAAENN
jgi:hypothetical protein